MTERKSPFGGVTALLPTPFFRDGGIDRLALDRLCERIFSAGCAAAVVTKVGERAALSEKERQEVVEEAVLAGGRRSRVFAGLCAEEGERAIEEGVCAGEGGASGLILECSGNFSGLYTLVRRLHKETGLPLAIERKSGKKSLLPFSELPSEEGKTAVIENPADPFETARFCAELSRNEKAPVLLFAGEETAFLCHTYGAKGLLSRYAAFDPLWVKALFGKRGAGAFGEYCTKAELFVDLWGEDGIPMLKRMLAFRGLCEDTVRLPLTQRREK